jgi:Uma2 family endonuclease
MTALPRRLFTLTEFLDWTQGQEGKFELVCGEVVAMAPGSIQHSRAKASVWSALAAGIKQAGLPCEAIADGPGVALADDSCYIPDVSVYCGERAEENLRLVPDPMIVVEVLSPSTEKFDMVGKLADYFTIPSIRHYLIVDLRRRLVLHHKRGDGGVIPTEILRDGNIVLDPPGITIPVSAAFGAQ